MQAVLFEQAKAKRFKVVLHNQVAYLSRKIWRQSLLFNDALIQIKLMQALELCLVGQTLS